MLAELASARDRERLEHSELARVARLTTAGVMTASIAHEIKQPLAAIVANGNAAQRWLSNASPDLIETRNALKHIIEDGHRVSRIIDSVRAMFKKDGSDKDSIDVNDLLENVLTLVHREIQRGGISVRANLPRDLPKVLADWNSVAAGLRQFNEERRRGAGPHHRPGKAISYRSRAPRPSKRIGNGEGLWNGDRS